MSAAQQIPLLLFPALLIVAALHDCASYTIPNWLSAAMVLTFFPLALLLGLPLPAIGLSALVGLGGLILGVAMFAAGWIGGGDAKVFAAATLWLGWPAATSFLLATVIAGGALAMLLLWLRGGWGAPRFDTGPTWLARLTTRGENVPYGVAIAAGGLIAFPQSAMLQHLPLAF